MTKTPFALAAVLGVVLTAGSLSAQSALRDVPRITEGVITIGMAYEITEQCGDIRPRWLRANSFINDLRSHASRLGFSRSEIDAYIDDKSEKDRLEAIARGRLASLGVVPGQSDTYCRVGQAEIAAGTPVGRLMR